MERPFEETSVKRLMQISKIETTTTRKSNRFHLCLKYSATRKPYSCGRVTKTSWRGRKRCCERAKGQSCRATDTKKDNAHRQTNRQTQTNKQTNKQTNTNLESSLDNKDERPDVIGDCESTFELERHLWVVERKGEGVEDDDDGDEPAKKACGHKCAHSPPPHMISGATSTTSSSCCVQVVASPEAGDAGQGLLCVLEGAVEHIEVHEVGEAALLHALFCPLL